MSFIGGLVQSILTDIAKEALLAAGKSNKSNDDKNSGYGCVIALLIVAFVLVGLIIYDRTREPEPKILSDWDKVKIGDSLFVRDDLGIKFFKKGMVKLNPREQREVKYAYEERLDFIEMNRVDDKFFFKNKTSFVGICIGIDSTRGRWLAVQPHKPITQPPKRKNQYDYETRRWEDSKYDILKKTKLSREFYVRMSDVTLANNDRLFK